MALNDYDVFISQSPRGGRLCENQSPSRLNGDFRHSLQTCANCENGRITNPLIAVRDYKSRTVGELKLIGNF
jgi:hypothetical protein